MPVTPSRFLEALKDRVLILDGAMGACVQSMDLSIEKDYLGRENCPDVIVRSRPDLVRSIHESFLEVGADAVETNTFGANRLVLGDFDEEAASWAFELNRDAARIARAACESFETADRPRFVIGSMGPGTKLISLGQTSWPEMLASYTEQARGLIAGGADAFLIETCQDLLQAKCAINACLDALQAASRTHDEIPILVSASRSRPRARCSWARRSRPRRTRCRCSRSPRSA